MTVLSIDFAVPSLGENAIPSPLTLKKFTPDNRRILFNCYLDDYRSLSSADGSPLSVEVAGPRDIIHFDPRNTKAAIVTCGGLCPGINDVIRSVVMELYHRYGVTNIVGIRYGFQGLVPRYGHRIVGLSPDYVNEIHTVGGSILSSSRGRQNIAEMLETLKRMNIDFLFIVEGDGSMRGA
ncbi:MAG: 6-phosphofructokinase, partial [Smithellaceae bacterium]|nr:6-phosphofructokinase [Smithellaceae bacterium]